MDWMVWIAVVLAAVLGTLLVVDVFHEVPWVRRYRTAALGALLVLGGVLLGSRFRKPTGGNVGGEGPREGPTPPPPPVPPAERYDHQGSIEETEVEREREVEVEPGAGSAADRWRDL